MRNLKRAVSFLLTVVMMMSLFVTPAAAKTDIGNESGDTGYEGFHNGKITVTAEDITSNNRISDVRFLLEDITAGRYTSYPVQTTGADGTATWNDLSAGTYRVTQVGQPEVYTPNTKHEIVTLRNDGSASTQSLFFENVRKGRLIIVRTDPTDGSPVNGGTYEVVNGEGKVVWTGTINNSGSITCPETLPTGNYIVREKNPPTGHNQVSPEQNVYLTPGNEPTIVTFTGAKFDTITVQLLDTTNYAPIAGATFEILKAEGSSVICSGKTDGNGLWTSKALDPGTYIVRQTAVIDGYQKVLASETVTITNDNEHKNHLVTLYNVPLGSITVMAYDTTTGKPLSGATVRLYDDKNTLIAETTSDINGRAVFPNIPDGHYTTTVTPPSGYAMNDASATVDVTGGSNSFVNVTGTELGSIQVRCLDARDGSPIEGATFKVYRMNGAYIGDMTTDANGTAIMTNLESGSYTVEQTFVPAGFVKITQTQVAKVVAGRIAECTFVNRVKPFVVVETMVEGTRQPISGSTVTLVNNAGTEVARGYTDVTGAVTFEDLEPGRYTAKYAWAPDGYTVVVASQEVVVTTEVSGYACLTADKHSAIIIYKVDSQTQEPLYGATFEVRDDNGRPVDYVTTDKSGVAATDILAPGTYTIREYFAPDHYVPNTEIRTVRVENNDSARETFTNTKKSQITVYAYDSMGVAMPNVPYIVYEAKTGQEVAHLLTNNSGFATTEELAPGNYIVVETTIPDNYTLVNPIQSHVVLLSGQASYVRYVHVLKSCIKIQTADAQTGMPVPGATYLITCNDSSYTANLTADANGEVITELLPEGIYEVKQITAPEGYLLNDTTQSIQVLRDQVNLAKFFNDPMARIVIQSVEAGTNYGLKECSFTVEDKDGKEVFHATTDDTGLLTTGALEPGTYTVKEIAVHDGFEIVQKSRTVEVGTYQSVSVKFEHVAKNSIIVKLTDINDPTKGLAGAHFMVRSMVGDYETEIVTDQSGRAETPVLPAGTYVVHQLTTAEGYMIYENYQYANVNEHGCAIVEFTNRKISGLVIEAMDEDTHEPIAGAEFEIFHENGKLVEHVTTDKTGRASVDGLTSDVYVIKNVKEPDGWTSRTLSQKVTITQGEPSTARFFFTSKSSLVITLTDEMSKEPLALGVFRIAKENGDIVQNDVSTDSDGRIILPKLDAGRYVITQIRAPEDYEIIRTPVTVDVKDNQTAYANITNMRHTGLTIEVLDDENNHLGGAQFELRDADGLLIGTYTAEASGIINISDLKAGTYTIKELKVPDGWTARTLTQTVTIVTNGNADAKFYHSRMSTMIIDLKDAADKTVLPGGRFRITDEAGKVLFDNEITDEAGLITLPSLKAGKYVITQVAAPDGYTMAKTSITAEVKDNETCYVHVVNNKNRGVTIEVLDEEGNYLTGANFEVRDMDGKLMGTYTVDATGTVFVGDLKAGEYQVKEIKVPDGWTAKTLSQTVTINTTNNATLKFYHSHKSSLVVTLKDAKTQATLSGGTFRVTSESGEVLFDNLTTDAAGQFTVPSLNAGKYVITQLTAPTGYTKMSESVTVDVRDNQTCYKDVYNDKNTGLTVEVLDDSNNRLGGAEFELRDSKGIVITTFTVDMSGEYYIDNLVAGEYTVNELKVPEGWTARTLTQKVTVTADGNAVLKFYHSHKSSLTINLKDADDKHALEGGEFKITTEDGRVIADSVMTNGSGQIVLDTLTAGRYIVMQVNAPKGYTPDKAPKTVEIKDNQNAEITVLNSKNMGLIIEVLDDDNNYLSGGRFELVDMNNTIVGTYDIDESGTRYIENLAAGKYILREIQAPDGWTPRTVTQNIEIKTSVDLTVKFYHTHKSTLEITLKDAITKDVLAGGVFKLAKANGDVVENVLTTDESGKIILSSVEAGEYILTQTTAPEGYVIKTVTYNVTVKDDQTNYVEVLNYRKTGLVIETLDSENNHISGATFEIYDANQVLVGTYTVDYTGILTVGELQPGDYTVKEVKVPEGWSAKTLTQTVTVKSDNDARLLFYHGKQATLTVNLKDAVSGAFLQGATYRITLANGEYFGEYKTNASGQFVVDIMPAGDYVVTMTVAPEGYVVDNTPYYVTIKDDKTVVLDLTLKALPNFRLINTAKQTGAPIGGNKFKIMTYEGKLVGNYTTDDAGLINLELKPGTYTVYQTDVVEGCVKNDTVWDVVIKAGEDFVLEVQNEIASRLVIKFVDATSNAPIYNVKVEVKDEHNNYIGQYTTDNTGSITLTSVFKAGKYKVSIVSCPDGYIKDTVPKTIEIKTGETTEMVWKLTARMGAITIVTYAGEDNALMQIAKNSKVAGAVYQITDQTGKVVTTISGDYNGEAHSGPLPMGTYFVQMVTPPSGFQLNNGRATVNVINTSDNKRVEVFLKAAYYNMGVKVNATQTVWAGQLAKYTFTDITNASSSGMNNFYLRIKVPTDAMRAVQFNTGSFNATTFYNIEYKTNTNDWRSLAQGCSAKSNYSYDLSTQGLGLGLGEYVTDIRMVFPSIIKGFKVTLAPSLYCAVLTGLPTGYMATVRAEVGGQVAYVQGAGNSSQPGNLEAGSWCSGAGQATTYIYGYQNVIPGKLPKTGY